MKPGDKVLVMHTGCDNRGGACLACRDGGYSARVRQVFPEGSTSYLFPHVKVDFDGGDKNVAVNLSRIYRGGGA